MSTRSDQWERKPDYINRLLRGVAWLLLAIGYMAVIVILFLWFMMEPLHAADLCDRYKSTLVREAQAVYGINAPTPMFMGQIRQESSCRADVTAWDNGRGLAQFMDGTSKQVAGLFPELGPPNPYSATWAIRALVRYDLWIYRRVKGKDECHRWAATLKGYNAGPGYVIQAQRDSPDPLIWFDVTEYIRTRQSPENFEYSRLYPHKILFKHQPRYLGMGHSTCLPRTP